MRNPQVHLTLFLLATSASWINITGCTERETLVSSVDRDMERDIIQDLGLPEPGTKLVQRTNAGDRDIAIVLTQSNAKYTLWCAYRNRDKSDQKNVDWKLWMDHEVIEDGTGAEVPAKRDYFEIPDTETIAAFRSDILNHWSNR